jgi:hypothetical protein
VIKSRTSSTFLVLFVYLLSYRILPVLLQSKMKAELKDWQKSFEARVGRPPTDADKSVIEDRFQSYQKVSRHIEFIFWHLLTFFANYMCMIGNC